MNEKIKRKTKPILYYLIDKSFQGVNRLFVLSFEKKTLNIKGAGYRCIILELAKLRP